MAIIKYNSRTMQKHDSSANWKNQESTFVPLPGEIIVYDDLGKIKIGNGSTTLGSLPFFLQNELDDKLSLSGGTITGDLTLSNGTTGLTPSLIFCRGGGITTDGYIDWFINANAGTLYFTAKDNTNEKTIEFSHLGSITAQAFNGNASSATKLATARTINGVYFDGTNSITITSNPLTTSLTSVDLNDFLTPGFYNGSGNNNCSNRPTDIDAFGMIVFKTAAGYTSQFLTGGNNQKNISYIRTYDGTSWTTWESYYNTANKPTASDITTGIFSSDRLPVISASKGGTGQTTLSDSANVLINALSEGTATPTDTDFYVSQYAEGGTTHTTYHRRPVSSLWQYIKNKASNEYSPKAGSTSLTTVGNNINLGDGTGDISYILKPNGTYLQKIEFIDNATAGDEVFVFSQSENSGNIFNSLMSINDDGSVIANKFIARNGINIHGAASDKPLIVRGIVGSDGEGNIQELYLQYGANNTIRLGNTGGYSISADGSYYDGKANTANSATKAASNSFFISNNNGGDAYIVLDRAHNASWKIIDTSGTLKFQCNYTTVKGDYYDVLSINHNDGNITSKGSITAPSFIGTATKATQDGSGNVITSTYATITQMNKRYDSELSRNANTVLAAPNGSAGSATFRKLVLADLPSGITASKLGSSTLGSSTRPIYLSSGTATACSTYAGGTKVTVNDSDRGGLTTSFYAPTEAGTSGYFLMSTGSGAPSWSQTLRRSSSYATSLMMGAGGNEVSGTYALATGYYTSAKTSQTVLGHYNAGTTAGSTTGTSGYALIIGNGTTSSRSNAFYVQYNGSASCQSGLTAAGADYAEYFEWLDGNINNEDRVGYFVTLVNNKIQLATPNSYILGIVSGNPSVKGNGDVSTWTKQYLVDDFGRHITEEYKYQEEKFDEETGETIIETKTGVRWIENPDYDPSLPYIQRADRPEWDAIGMVGVLAVRDDGTCQINGYCKVATGGIATAADSDERYTYRVIERVNDHVIKVIFK